MAWTVALGAGAGMTAGGGGGGGGVDGVNGAGGGCVGGGDNVKDAGGGWVGEVTGEETGEAGAGVTVLAGEGGEGMRRGAGGG